MDFSGPRHEFAHFVEVNKDRSVGEVSEELRGLINEWIEWAWYSAGEEMRAGMLGESPDYPARGRNKYSGPIPDAPRKRLAWPAQTVEPVEPEPGRIRSWRAPDAE